MGFKINFEGSILESMEIMESNIYFHTIYFNKYKNIYTYHIQYDLLISDYVTLKLELSIPETMRKLLKLCTT